jgi:methionyl-tRNA synthetase
VLAIQSPKPYDNIVYRRRLNLPQLGNLVSRVASMIRGYFEGRVPTPGDVSPEDQALLKSADGLLEAVDAAMDAFEIDSAVRRIWEVVREANRYVVEQEPWTLARDPAQEARRRLSTILYNLAEAIRMVGTFSSPFIPSKSSEIASGFSLGKGWDRLSERAARWGVTEPGTRVEAAGTLFPKELVARERK